MTENAEPLVDALLRAHGKGFAEELGIDLSDSAPEPLFRWLTAVLLLSARISSDLAMRGAAALAEEGWTTAAKMAESSWEDRTRTLNRSGYARYDEKTSAMLGEMADRMLADYDGDLNALREAAGRDPSQERERIKAVKGIGDVGADIFFREVQTAWDEHFPFADARALNAAQDLGLCPDAARLAELVPKRDFPRLLAALIRAEHAGESAEDLLAAQT